MSETSEMCSRPTSVGTDSAISLPGSASGATRYASPAGRTIDLFGPDHALVSPSATPEVDLVQRMRATCGPLGSSSSASVALARSLVSRLRPALADCGSPLYRLTWKRWDTPAQGLIYQLRASGRRTGVNGCSGWPTPVANDDKKSVEAHLAMKRRMGERDGTGANRMAVPSLQVAAKTAGGPNTDGSGLGEQRSGLPKDRDPQPRRDADGRGATSGMGDASGSRLERRPSERRDFGGELQAAERAGGVLGMGDANSVSSKQGSEVNGRRDSRGDAQPRGGLSGPNGLRFWSQCDWIPCRAPRRGIIYRPVEAGTFPLASRCPGDVGKIRAYGNSIVPQAAAAFIRAAMEHLRWHRRQDDSGRGDEDEKLPKD